MSLPYTLVMVKIVFLGQARNQSCQVLPSFSPPTSVPFYILEVGGGVRMGICACRFKQGYTWMILVYYNYNGGGDVLLNGESVWLCLYMCK